MRQYVRCPVCEEKGYCPPEAIEKLLEPLRNLVELVSRIPITKIVDHAGISHLGYCGLMQEAREAIKSFSPKESTDDDSAD